MEQLLDHVRGYSFGRTTLDNGGVFGPILRPYICLLLVEEGACVIQSDDDKVIVRAGQTAVAASRKQLDFNYVRGIQTTVVWCEGFLPTLPDKRFQEMYRPLKPVATSRHMLQLQQVGVDTGHDSNPELNSVRNAIGLALMRLFLLETRKGEQISDAPASLMKARRFIVENLGDETLSIATVAEHASISQQHLISAFRKHFGSTPSRYIWRLRANRARQLLVHSRFSLAEIAFKCGYKSQPHFSRTMKNLFGMTPAQLRQDMGYTQSSNTDVSLHDVLL